MAVELEQFRCVNESKRYRAMLEQGQLNEKENQNEEREKSPPSVVVDEKKKKKPKRADPVRLLSGRPSRVRIQNELTSALKRTNGKGKRRKKNKGPLISKVIDPTIGVELIKQLKQVYPFSTCCGAHCRPIKDDKLVDLDYYLQPQTPSHSLFAMTSSVPNDLTEQDVRVLHDNDVEWLVKDTLGVGTLKDDSYGSPPSGANSRRVGTNEESGAVADLSVEFIDRREDLNGQQLSDRSKEIEEVDDPSILGCGLTENMANHCTINAIRNDIIPDSQEDYGEILVMADEIADESVEVVDISSGKQSNNIPGGQSRSIFLFEHDIEETANRRVPMDSVINRWSRQNTPDVLADQSMQKSPNSTNQRHNATIDSSEPELNNTDSPPELEEPVSNDKTGSCLEETGSVIQDSEAEDDLVLIPSSPAAGDDSVVIQTVQHTAPQTTLIISDSEPEFDDLLPAPTTTTTVSDSEEETDLELRLPASSTTANPRYELYTTQELRSLIKQYGFKPIRGRSDMIQLLQSCHTEPTVLPPPTDNSNFGNDKLDEMLYQQIDENIKSHPDYTIYEQIISYEPIDILTLHSLITDNFNIPINLDEAKLYCDLRGICFTTNNDLTNSE